MTVLALEFRGVRETADFSFLAKEMPDGRLRRVDPLVDQVAAPRTLREQAHMLVKRPPNLVLAYCSCAALGAHVAELSGARLVLVNPDAVTPEAARRDFVNLCRTLGCAPPSFDGPSAWELAFSSAREGLASQYGGDQEAFEMVDDLFDRYRAWLRFLHASAASDPASPTADVMVIASKPVTTLAPLLVSSDRVRLRPSSGESATLESPEVQQLLLAQVADVYVGAEATER